MSPMAMVAPLSPIPASWTGASPWGLSGVMQSPRPLIPSVEAPGSQLGALPSPRPSWPQPGLAPLGSARQFQSPLAPAMASGYSRPSTVQQLSPRVSTSSRGTGQEIGNFQPRVLQSPRHAAPLTGTVPTRPAS